MLNIYFAGELFDHKHLSGNMLLAEYIEHAGTGRYKVILPQTVEHAENRFVDIRNKDLELLFSCDVALFNFDGCDLDSGTVAEFIYAKMLDIPSVLIRTDVRIAGDQGEHGDPWNLMCSGYPRTERLHFNAMAEFHKNRRSKTSDCTARSIIAGVYSFFAEEIIASLDRVVAMPGQFNGDLSMAAQIYNWTAKCSGSGLDQLLTPEKIDQIIHGKSVHKLI
jgi:nucleoside 2-deoxyribosyltransferase